ncbi:hypothetical protein IMG5_010250 [Ichthyophthirius multifiliis]|uniref:ubiquitinyl hydrolase 1 n=1 Tax=Ichthyophthirius multifiliis TaxID=5932 RepID=G0QJX5_ICHMU|nr:hypothetical protein IMG5_010250 [Ichthyophthirius multifiliis]EGR34476.1 hypothetical protein IMG5_010250 [Ichthyophthirius multifiliis]|eukprot:XP_004039780.1 hypothetical protein IMG5_010250 [Ichthyophthirius multifiliis]
MNNQIKFESISHLNNYWENLYKIGPGLRNLGNTCFMNSVLQCITHTPLLVNYLLSNLHACQKKQCIICVVQKHVKQCFSNNSNNIIAPSEIINNMKYINKNFRLGKQHDSHEFLRFLLEAMQKSYFIDIKKQKILEEQTPIFNIFGGKLISQIQCFSCKQISQNIETFYDLLLECKQNIDQSFESFFKKEILSGNNKYRCSFCKNLVDCSKGYVIQKFPNILTIQLKRFNNFMMKVNKHTQFAPTINLKKYSTNQKDQIYDLYGILIHVGHDLNYGHYYCYTKSPNKQWYCMNDSSVNQVSFQEVQNEKAFLLFYSKREEKKKKEEINNPEEESVTQQISKQQEKFN